MRGAYDRPIARREQNRHTVGDLNDANTSTNTRHYRIAPRSAHFSIRSRGALQTIQVNYINSMHLLQPHRLGRQPQVIPHAPPILRNRTRSIPNVRTNIE
jgi:hypothetical protein